jgi:hypothetical protein
VSDVGDVVLFEPASVGGGPGGGGGADPVRLAVWLEDEVLVEPLVKFC